MSFEHTCVFDWRYGSSEMRDLFKAENIVKTYIRVEQALLKGLEEAGLAPRGCSELASSCMNSVTARDVL